MASRRAIRALLLLMAAQLNYGPSLAQSYQDRVVYITPRPPQWKRPAPGRQQPVYTRNPIIKLTAGPIRVVDPVDYERIKYGHRRSPQWEQTSDFYRAEAWPRQHRASLSRAFHDGPPVVYDGHSRSPIADRSIYDEYSARHLNAAVAPPVIDGQTKPQLPYRDFLSSERSAADDFGLPPWALAFLYNKWAFPFRFPPKGSTAPKKTHASNDAVKMKHHELHHLPKVSEQAHNKYSLDEEVETIDKCPHGHCESINTVDHGNFKARLKRENYEDDLDDYGADSSISATWKKDNHGRSTKNCPPGMELFAGRCREISLI